MHDETPQQFLGYFIADIHHKTKPEVLPIRFYVFKDTTSPKILLSYTVSERLGIVKFQIPNEAPSIALDTTSMKKHITFRTPLHTYRSVKPKNTGQHLLKPVIKKQPFQYQTLQKQSFQDHPAAESSKIQPLQDHSEQKNALQEHSRQESLQKQLFQDHFTTDDVHDIIAMKKVFTKSFDHVGNMPGTYTIWLDPSVPPAQHARRKVPTEYKEHIEKALQHMEDLKIITPVTIPTEWVSSITYPRKPDGTLCICWNPRDLNKAIIREHYQVPTLEEISHKLAGTTVFSKLDAKDGFWSIHLDDASSHLTTFNTCKGRYRFLRMPFGLKMAQDVFQMRMDQITERLPGIIAIHDDICVFGKIQQQHDKHLLQLLKTASAKGLVFSSRKCQISKPQITFFGTIFSAKGMKPDPIKIQALQDLPTPQTQKQLQSFLGLVNYLQPFIPDIAARTTFLREQVSKWDWTPSTDSAFQQLKQWICKTLLKTTLAYYNRSQPLSIQTDASEYGLGAALLQNNRPIPFASKTLTDVETRYANIERECLSFVFGLEKFHTYIYGRTHNSFQWPQALRDDN